MKKAQKVLSAKKDMVTLFWGAHYIIHIDYLQMANTIYGEYYINLNAHVRGRCGKI